MRRPFKLGKTDERPQPQLQRLRLFAIEMPIRERHPWFILCFGPNDVRRLHSVDGLSAGQHHCRE